METISWLNGAILQITLLGVVLSTGFIWYGARVTRVEKPTFLKALLSALIAALLIGLVVFLFGRIEMIGNIIGFLIGLILGFIVIRETYQVSGFKILVIWLFFLLAEILALASQLLFFLLD